MDETPIRATKRIYAVGIAVLALLIVAGAGYTLFVRAPEQERLGAIETGITGENASSAPVIVGVEGTGNYTIDQVPLSQGNMLEGMPQLRRPVVFSSAFSLEARRLVMEKIDASITALERDPRVFDQWMQLAILRKTVDDYEGAREIWEFLTRMKPEQPSPYANLAGLYTYELNNPALAEKNFVIAIQKGPKELSVYRNAYDFYRYVQKDDRKAKEILQDGIKETQSADLQYLLDHYGEL